MGSSARRAMNRSGSSGAFGGRSGRDLPWQADGTSNGESSENAPVRSSFGSQSARGGVPSAAFSGAGDRFALPKPLTPGPGAYSGERAPLTPTNRINRSASFGGRSKRFGTFKEEDTPGPAQFAGKPGAFAAVTKSRNNHSSGFGSRAERASPFGVRASADVAPAPGTYDAHSSTGAFAAAQSSGRGPATPTSAAFASRSTRFDRPGSARTNEGPDPTAYNAQTYDSMASKAGKTFNKSFGSGGGGFGTSTRRPDVTSTPRDADQTPGPGAYEDDRKAADSRRASQGRPSAGFASKTAMHESHIRKNDAPPAEYDVHRSFGMAATAAKSFNKNVGTNRFGPRAARPLEGGGRNVLDDTPAPGAYSAQDPTRPTCTATAQSARGRPATAFSSSAVRDTARWTGAVDIE